MNYSKLFRRRVLPFLLLGLIAVFFGCQNEMVVEPVDTEPTTDQGALEKMVDEDSALTSFDYNYNEDGLMDFLGKTNEPIFPFRVGHKMRLVHRNLNITFQDTIAYGTLTKTFEGLLLIAATYDSNGTEPDTIIEKPFTAVVTRNIIFKKIAHTPFPMQNWVIAAISLPEGGTQSPNIDLMKLTAYLPNGDTIQVNSPNDYYVTWRFGWWRQIPVLHRGESVRLVVELFSAYEEVDFVTLTYGANRFHNHRAKKLFELVSSTPSGNGWEKVYEQTYTTHQFPGFYHAVINAMPRQVIFDDATPVESEAWGMPYVVLP